VQNNPVNFTDSLGLSPQDRVSWVLAQYLNNRTFWKGSFLRKQNKCNEFVAAAHILGDPDAYDYPTVLRNNDYYLPLVSNLADPGFARSRLTFLPLDQAQPGDIIVWYGSGTHHSAIYVGDNLVIYQHYRQGLILNTVQGYSDARGFTGTPIVRRYNY
jgi:hypothetical protein